MDLESRTPLLLKLGFNRESISLLKSYLELLWNSNLELNLISRKMTEEELLDNHVIDSLLPLKYFPESANRIADFGSGFRADSLRYLLERKFMMRGIGLDLSITDEKFENINMFVEDFEKGVKNLAGESVDCVLSLAILEHLYNPKLYLQDVYKSLKPGGVLLLTTPSPYSKPVLEFLSRQLKLIDRKEIDDHKHYFSLSELETLAKEVGFKEFKASYFELGMNDFLLAKK